MQDIDERASGWKPIPLALKILAVVMVLWSLGAVMNLPYLMQNGLPLFGVLISGTMAVLVVLLLDFIGPLGFLYALWKRKSWGPVWAFAYMGIFILNGLVALVIARGLLGVAPILIPTVASAIFALVIYWHRDYFR